MEVTTSGSKGLLKKIRTLMAEVIKPQERLNLIVQAIAREMVAEVCSFYVLRSESVLELHATEGLNPKAVCQVRLRLGQGLVGTIAATARPLNLSDAQQHPAFAYLPETGEEIYASFLGVPILRLGKAIGVLVVQNCYQRTYSDDEIEALEIVAMVLAEMVSSGDLPRVMQTSAELDVRSPLTITGQSLNEGVGLGHVFLHEPRIVVTKLFSDDSAFERKRLQQAIDSLRLSIDSLLSRGDVANEGEHRDVLAAYRMFANDRGWVRRLEETVDSGLTAEAAVKKVQSDTRARMLHAAVPDMRERLSDFDDLANRLLYKLMGAKREGKIAALPKDAVIVARSMGAAELLDYPRERLKGLVLEDSAATSHVTIVARALGIPVVGQAKAVVALSENGDSIIMDGGDGKVFLRPQFDVKKAYAEKAQSRRRQQKHYKDLRHVPSVTKDGKPIALLANAGLCIDLPHLKECGAQGIGLLRTELQFMISATFPRAQQQEKFYRSIYQAIGDMPVTFRTLDIGGDKILPYWRAKDTENNPALGWRAVRLTLDRPALMRMQLRTLLKASSGRALRIMLPMVTEIDEIHRTRRLIASETAYLSRFGYGLPTRIKLGAMIEVPSLLFQLDEVMQAVDFVSVGSNDLFQFTMAVDRGHAKLLNRFDAVSVPFFRVLRRIVEAAERNDIPLTLCGECARRPLAAMALIGLGFRRISMMPLAIGPVKAMLLSLDSTKLETQLLQWLEQPVTTTEDFHNFLTQFAKENHVALEPS